MRSRTITYHQYEKKKPNFGDFRWDYVKTCKHDLIKSNTCPFCLIISNETKKYFEDELIRKDLAKENSIQKRAILRYNLLHLWARGQRKAYSLQTYFCVEIGFTEKTFIALNSLRTYVSQKPANLLDQSDLKSDLDDHLNIKTLNILKKRKGIMEVSSYAVILIQRNVRGYCVRRRVKMKLLQRFILIYSKSGDYFYDNERQTAWDYNPPKLIQYERPSSPRTIQRRILATTKLQNARLQSYYESLQKFEQNNPRIQNKEIKTTTTAITKVTKIASNVISDFSLWKKEAEELSSQRQILLFYDYLTLAIQIVTNNHHQQQLRQNVSSSKSAPMTPAPSSKVPKLPVYPVFSSPLPSVRDLGLSLVLKYGHKFPSLPFTYDLQGSTSLKPSSTGIQDTNNDQMLEINNRLLKLESQAWRAVRCQDASDLLKILLLEDLENPLQSVALIGSDECNIWNGTPGGSYAGKVEGTGRASDGGDVDGTLRAEAAVEGGGVEGQRSVMGSKASRESSSSEVARENTTDVAVRTETTSHLLLPVHIELRPFPEDRDPSWFFRLFFVDGQLVAATQISAWTFNKKVAKNRNEILAAIFRFRDSPVTTSEVSRVQRIANSDGPLSQKAEERNDSVTATGTVAVADSKDRKKSLSKTSGSVKGRRDSNVMRRPPPDSDPTTLSKTVEQPPDPVDKSGLAPNCVSLFVPSEEVVFGQMIPLKPMSLADSEVDGIGKSYGFLHTVDTWKDRVRTATIRSVKKPILEQNESIEIDEDGNQMSTLSSSQNIRNDEVIRGSDAYRLSCVDLPISALKMVKKGDDLVAQNSKIQSAVYGSATVQSTTPANSLSYASLFDKQPSDEHTSSYFQKLISSGTSTDLTMLPRIRTPPKATETLKPPQFNLVVIDVYLDPNKTVPIGSSLSTQPTVMPPAPAPAPGIASNNATKRRQSRVTGVSPSPSQNVVLQKLGMASNTRGSVILASLQQPPVLQNESVTGYVCELHQLVGVYTTESNKPPASLELGLFPWSYFSSTPPLFEGAGEMDTDTEEEDGDGDVVEGIDAMKQQKETDKGLQTEREIQGDRDPLQESLSARERDVTAVTAIPKEEIKTNEIDIQTNGSRRASLSRTVVRGRGSVGDVKDGGRGPVEPAMKAPPWAPAKKLSGLSIYSEPISSKFKANFEFRMICDLPSRGYIVKRVPKKIRHWVGIE